MSPTNDETEPSAELMAELASTATTTMGGSSSALVSWRTSSGATEALGHAEAVADPQPAVDVLALESVVEQRMRPGRRESK